VECLTALRIFNSYHPDKDDLAIIYPVLLEILQTLILGMAEVEHYFAHQAQKLELPRVLMDKKYVYVRTGDDDVD
jgi:hypothetical protein